MFTTIARIITIARKDFTEMLRDGRFRGMAAVVTLLLLTAFALGAQHYSRVRQEHEALRRLSRQQWLNQKPKDPHNAAHFGVFVVKPVPLLSLADRGVDAYTGVAIHLAAHQQSEAAFRPARDTAALCRFGEMTAAGVLQLLLPLLIVLLVFPSFAGEREAGTLRLSLSMGIHPRDLALGKVLGAAGALGVLLLPTSVIGAATLLLCAPLAPAASGDGLSRLAFLATAYVLYFTAFAGVALALSACARSAYAALVWLLGFWFVSCIILPRVATDVARHRYPTPSALSFERGFDHAKNEHMKAFDGRAERRRVVAEALRRYGVTTEKELPINVSGILMQKGEQQTTAVSERHFAGLWNTFERQNTLSGRAALLAPLLAIRSLSMGLAGTDWQQHRHFSDAAERYRRRMVAHLNEDLTNNSARPAAAHGEYRAGRAVWASLPDFVYEAPDARWVLGRQRGACGVLLAWSVGAVAVALVCAARAARVQ